MGKNIGFVVGLGAGGVFLSINYLIYQIEIQNALFAQSLRKAQN